MLFFPAVTAAYAAIFAFILVGLSAWVVATRLQTDVLQGDGNNEALTRRMRAQANFAEYIPFTLLIIALLEASGGGFAFVQTLCIILLIARILHPIGMLAPKNSPQQYICRGGGIFATFGVLLVAAAALLIHVA